MPREVTDLGEMAQLVSDAATRVADLHQQRRRLNAEINDALEDQRMMLSRQDALIRRHRRDNPESVEQASV